MNFFFFFLLLISLLIIYRTIAIWYNCKRKMQKYPLYTSIHTASNSSFQIQKIRQANFVVTDQSRSKGKENFTVIQFTCREFLSSPGPSKRCPFATPFFSPFSLLLACVGATWLRHKARLERGKRIYEGVFTGVTSRSRDALLLIDDRNLKNIAIHVSLEVSCSALRGFAVNLLASIRFFSRR